MSDLLLVDVRQVEAAVRWHSPVVFQQPCCGDDTTHRGGEKVAKSDLLIIEA